MAAGFGPRHSTHGFVSDGIVPVCCIVAGPVGGFEGRICPGSPIRLKYAALGDVAQLGERRVRNAKVEGSIPFVSTNFTQTTR